MNNDKDISALLVEFDSIKGPVIRKIEPIEYKIAKEDELEKISMWILRATEFSVRKINNQIICAKTIELNDPYFLRKKRQFGIALLSNDTLEINKAEFILKKILEKCKLESDNKPYFKMLCGLLDIVSNFKGLIKSIGIINKKNTDKENQSIVLDYKNYKIDETQKQKKQFLFITPQMNLFNKVIIEDKKNSIKTIICLKNKSSKINEFIGQKIEQNSNRFLIQLDLQNERTQELMQGLEILLRNLETLPEDRVLNERLVIAIEYFDHLLSENVDIPYFLPFLQYLTSMEIYTINEFNYAEFLKQLLQLKETHGEWIECLKDNNLNGKNLTKFFEITGLRRGALELLIDLLFVKIITIF